MVLLTTRAFLMLLLFTPPGGLCGLHQHPPGPVLLRERQTSGRGHLPGGERPLVSNIHRSHSGWDKYKYPIQIVRPWFLKQDRNN